MDDLLEKGVLLDVLEQSHMIYNVTTLMIVVLALFANLDRADAGDSIDTDTVRSVKERSVEDASKLQLTRNVHEEYGKAKAREMADFYYSESYQNRIKAETERLKQTVFGTQFRQPIAEQSRNYYGDQATPGKLPQNERLYIFISSSMPLHVLRNYMADADKISDPNIIFVMRGFVGGVKYLKPTKGFAADMLRKSPGCTGQCESFNVSLQIDPALFVRYGISEVPAFVYVPNIQIVNSDRSEGEKDSAKVGTYITVKGDMSLENVLEKLQVETGSRTLASVLTALRSGFFN